MTEPTTPPGGQPEPPTPPAPPTGPDTPSTMQPMSPPAPPPPSVWAQNQPPPDAPYPIGVPIDRDRSINRLWGIPILGVLVRSIIVIPQVIILAIWGFVIYLVLFVNWIPVLFTGHMAGWAYSVVGGYIRLLMRVSAYLLLLAVPYPWFGSGPNEAFDVRFDRNQHVNNLWGIPIIGLTLRALFLIPSAIVLWVLGIAAGILSLFTWIPVLLFGRYPQIGYDIVGGYLRWTTRVFGWFFMLSGPYPPFRLSE